ncbi:MAG: hypothetical protein Q4C98_09265 [Capnocytophaga sp.]|nr:hypothetical protein [Capnocytophaga sp.]
MKHQTYILDLIERMLDNTWAENATSSEDTPSWKAHREAEKIKNEELIPDLIAFIQSEKNAEKRKQAYWILGKIAENTHNQNALQFIIHQIDNEKDTSVITKILSAIKNTEKSAETDLSPIFHLITQGDDELKNDAISVLQKTHHPTVEPLILEICSAENSNEYRLWHCLQTLQNIGTRASMDTLLALAGHKKTDVAVSALFAILKIGDERELPIFEKYIQEGRNKDVALYAICKLGNEKHIPLIIKRIKEVLSRKRSEIVFVGNFDEDKSEIMHGLDFLAKFKNQHPDIQPFFDFIKTKKWDKLFKEEQTHSVF